MDLFLAVTASLMFLQSSPVSSLSGSSLSAEQGPLVQLFHKAQRSLSTEQGPLVQLLHRTQRSLSADQDPLVQLLHRTQRSLSADQGPLVQLLHRTQRSLSADQGPLVQLLHRTQRRQRRCSCENQKDRECFFFCHIGIVWVTSPRHVVPYGFGPA